MKIRYISAAIALTVLIPFAASALSVCDLQQQIENLLAQIAGLQGQIRSLQTTSPVACTMDAKQCPDGSYVGRSGPNCEFAACPGETAPPIGRICPQILRTLAQGVSGTDVRELQAYLGVSQTGYFGPLTASAVAQFQSSEGLARVGIVGPQTRAAFARRCGTPRGGDFSASPMYGPPPLRVDFTYAPKTENSGQYYIDFGDGQGQIMDVRQIYCIRASCISPSSASHTYSSSGTYTATVSPYIACLYSNPRCMMAQPAPLGTVAISVGNATSGGAPSINGLDAPTSLGIGQSGTWTVRASVPNQPNSQLSYSVTWGDETAYPYALSSAPASSAPLQTNATFTHAYQSAGTFNPVFVVSNNSGSARASASVKVGETPLNCPQYSPPAPCPLGQHTVITSPATTDWRGCYVPAGQMCVPDTDMTFTASPTLGSAPLSVVFTSRYGDDGRERPSYADGVDTVINFGDASPEAWVDCATGNTLVTARFCVIPAIIQHTYSRPGTYTAMLKRSGGYCAGPCTDTILATLKIVVVGPVSAY